MRGSALLAAAALLAALAGGHEQAPSTFGCPNTIRALCNDLIQPDYVARCKLCTGGYQHALRAAGCSAADVQLFCAAGWGDPSRPNIIFVLTDDMGWGDFSYNNVSQRFAFPGAGRSADDPFVPNPPRTPNIDAMARGSNTLLFHRFYAGSAVCSPTRASALTGRTSDRECIGGAEGCGQEPAWSCNTAKPLPPTTFTVAKAAKKAGYSTIHIGKWQAAPCVFCRIGADSCRVSRHLGNFFPKPWLEASEKKPSFAEKKWPSSSPGHAGFDEWHSTEASASSSMCNCGCRPEWAARGCITGGGQLGPKAYPCVSSRPPPASAALYHPPLLPDRRITGARPTSIL